MKNIFVLVLFFLTLQIGYAQKQKIYNPTKFLALGDSYTIGESVGESERWPNQLMDSLFELGVIGPKPKIIATTGWRTDQLKNAILNSGLQDTFNLVSVLIGVNNQYQGRNISQQQKEFPEILDLAIEKAGGDTSKVFVVSIPDYAFTPFGQSKNPAKISSDLDLYNTINDSISKVYGVNYFDITPISRNGLTNTALVASDGLHPSGFQYSKWVSLILKSIEIESNSVSIEKQNSLKRILFFNSTTNVISVDRNQNQNIEIDSITIFDLTGKVVFQNKISLNQNSIKLPQLKQGNYVARINGFEPLQIIISSR